MKLQNGDIAHVHYIGTFDDGSEFDSTYDRDPLEFEVGAEEVIPGFEACVVDMEIGEKKSVRIPVEDAYGEYHEEYVVKLGRNDLPDDLEPTIGDMLEMVMDDESSIMTRVVEIGDDFVVIDANHELAGKDLNFEIELVKIN